MSALVCGYCSDVVCTTCDDAVDHDTAEPHCSDPRCIARCTACGVAVAEEIADGVAADIALTGPARCP